MNSKLDLATGRAQLLGLDGTVLIHMSMRDTQVCHVLPPFLPRFFLLWYVFVFSLSDR
ncbi:hypothetical protein BN77_0792 [Rhizobium mesoamericanum STM3625]|uniref:Uncharacterized protein n=1 Tax=Rhizobium mesoamericanum STM3625 TaxID=1211777 RepID=K0Q4H3_9HYPH|nr:hypothetical protein BN77_0792 [Rhizobium mesoamericanum STM3625]